MNNQVKDTSAACIADQKLLISSHSIENRNPAPAGYKQAEVGLIPMDWSEVTVDSLVESLDSGVSVNSIDKPHAFPHGKHILKTSCVDNGNFYPSEQKSIIPNDVKRAKCSLKKNAIIISRMNTPALVGEIGYVSNDDPNTFLPDRLWQMRYRKNSVVNSRWLTYLLSYSTNAQRIKEAATGTSGSMKNISKESFLSLLIPYPMVKEQTAIANALSDVDALIDSLEALIAKKKAIKTATMQQLLTGRTRLPQFARRLDGTLKGTKHTELGEIPEDWVVGRFGELFEPTIQRETLNPEDFVSFIGMQDVTENALLEKQTTIQYKNIKPGLTYFEKGDVLVAKITPCFENGKGCHTDSIDTDFGYGSTEFHVLRATEISDPKFIYFWTTRKSLRVSLETEMIGSAGHRRVPFSSLQNFPIPYPTETSEQIAIADTLVDMHAEIQSLEKRLAKTRQLKQGMMQELLTGKTRLV